MTVTDDYLLSRARLAARGATILDLGCGDGRFVEMLLDAGFKAYGADLPDTKRDLERRFARRSDMRGSIIFIEDEKRIPLPDRSVDVVLSNTVFEHIPDLGATVRELARILKPSGAVYTVFPLKSAIMEQHIHLPFFHRIGNRPLRRQYARMMKSIGLYRGLSEPDDLERFVYKYCFYRGRKEVEAMFRCSFASVKSDAGDYAGYKRAWLKPLAPIIHHYHAAAYRLASPRESGSVASPP